MSELTTIEKQHALLSASSSERWINCTPSARLEEKFENKTSPYAEEGTLAHAFAELALKSYFTLTTKKEIEKELKELRASEIYKSEMENYTEDYLDYIKEKALETPTKPYVGIESKLDFSNYAKEGFGTADCLMVKDDVLHVIDFKYGKGVPVSSENNPQMMLYALGAYNNIRVIYNIKTVRLTIFQPRIDNISEWELSLEELLNWGENVLKPKADLAHKGLGEFVAGDHCRFCRAKAVCKARFNKAEAAIEFMKETKESDIITYDVLGNMLRETEWVKDYIEEVGKAVLSNILDGNEVEGWKAVEGRSNRKLVDIDKAFKVLKDEGFKDAMLYEKKPLGITELERLLTKKRFNVLIGDFVEKPKGKPTLAYSADKRAPYQKVSAKEEFNESGD